MCRQSELYQYWIGSVLLVLCTVAAAANAIIIEIYILQRKYRATYHLAYIHLAFLDCCSSLYGAVFRAPSYLFGTESEVQCSMQMYLTLVLTHANLSAVLPITYDRFTAVVRPIQYKKPHHLKILAGLMGLCWVFPLLFLITLEMLSHWDGMKLTVYEANRCDCVISTPRGIEVAFHVRDAVFMYLPTLINIMLYSAIMRRLASSRKRFRSVHGYLILTRVMAIGILYTVSWVPTTILGYLHLTTGINEITILLMQSTLYLNCFFDPLLYTIPNRFLLKLFRNRSNFINEKKTFGSVDRQIQKTKAMKALSRRFSNRTYIKQKSAELNRIDEQGTVISNVSQSQS